MELEAWINCLLFLSSSCASKGTHRSFLSGCKGLVIGIVVTIYLNMISEVKDLDFFSSNDVCY